MPLANSYNFSPLRYPGGKSCLAPFLTHLAELNDVKQGTYLELYAGGAGAALTLLFDGTFKCIHINDYDYNIYAMWYSILFHPKVFINKIKRVAIDIDEWHRQKEIFKMGRKADIKDLGFATFFLNRTNRSGIIFKAGPIGGLNQNGNYKIDVRFNKEELIERIKLISSRKKDIILTNLDAIHILDNLQSYHVDYDKLMVYMDPPYYKKGKELYLNNYNHDNHLRLASTVKKLNDVKWMISYDNVHEVRNMYEGFRMSSFDLNYTLQTKRFGSELLVFSEDLITPEFITIKKRKTELTFMNT